MLTLLITAILGFLGILVVEVDTKRKSREMKISSISSSESEDDPNAVETIVSNDTNSNGMSSKAQEDGTPKIMNGDMS